MMYIRIVVCCYCGRVGTTKWKQKQINTLHTAHSDQFQLFHNSSRQQYGMYIIHYSAEHIAFSAE